MQASHLSDVAFASLGLHPKLLAGLDKLGFSHCTPIQAACLPLALAGRDLAGQAQTGTGKTAAFLLATMHHLLTQPRRGPEGQPRAFMLAPTRELAVQIFKDAEQIGADTGLKMTVCYGGAGYESQRQSIADGVDILIGTPGRLIDYFKQHVFDLKSAQVLVLDEADRMFDLGFIADIRYILRRLPPPGRRQSMLFSATLSHRVLELAYEHMNNPELVRIEPDKMTVDRVRQLMYYPSMEEKVPLLIGLLHQSEAVRTMVFVNTKRMAERLESVLRANGFQAQALSGDVPQNKRLRFLRDFHDGKLAVLIATDVASRGLHIPDVSHVFNFDLPQDAPDYVHRIGRTARAGAEGDAISFACEDTAVSLPDIESYIGHKIPYAPIAPELLATGLLSAPHTHRPHGGGGRRHGAGARRHGGGGSGGGGRRGSHSEGARARRGRRS
ncbi:MAG: DEAD/DEAH box helicase [Gammaproteobacteria bacterium]|nr:DEAD/DEAH box helicase [Gammaproteobacteria bacterium]